MLPHEEVKEIRRRAHRWGKQKEQSMNPISRRPRKYIAFKTNQKMYFREETVRK